jgi:hypothetical protein
MNSYYKHGHASYALWIAINRARLLIVRAIAGRAAR